LLWFLNKPNFLKVIVATDLSQAEKKRL